MNLSKKAAKKKKKKEEEKKKRPVLQPLWGVRWFISVILSDAVSMCSPFFMMLLVPLNFFKFSPRSVNLSQLFLCSKSCMSNRQFQSDVSPVENSHDIEMYCICH